MTEKPCCAALARAQEAGTDNEGYGRAVHFDGAYFWIGTAPDSMNFCPWCGRRLVKAAEAVDGPDR